MKHEAAYQALSKAKIGLMSKDGCAFFASVCLSMKHLIDEECPTAYTNGLMCGYNPTFFLAYSPEYRESTVFHETGHVCLQHPSRCGDRDFQLWNIAGDHVINLIAKNMGFSIPNDWLCDSRFTGMSTEEIYDILVKENQKNPEKLSNTNPLNNDIRLPDTEEKATAIKDEVDGILIQAAMQGKMAGEDPGNIPGEVARHIEKLLNPKIPWYRLMRSYARKFSKENYSLQKRNRRFPDHILPSRYSEKMASCAFIVDASGSVNDNQFSHMINETSAFIKDLEPEIIDFIQFDTKIKTNDKVKTLADLRAVNFHGRGGTRIAPVFDWIIENKPVVSVIFTDGFFAMPELRPKTPILWIIHSNPTWTAPVGRVIHFEFDPK